VSKVVEVTIEGVMYRCYRTWCVDPEWNGPVDSFIVAGLGTVSVERHTGVVVSTAPVVRSAVPVLEKMAPFLAARMRQENASGPNCDVAAE
jgi:hypothetical protein